MKCIKHQTENQFADIEDIKSAILTFSKILSPEYEKGLEFLSEQVIGIGMGEQGNYRSKEELRSILQSVQKLPSDSETNTKVQLKGLRCLMQRMIV